MKNFVLAGLACSVPVLASPALGHGGTFPTPPGRPGPGPTAVDPFPGVIDPVGPSSGGGGTGTPGAPGPAGPSSPGAAGHSGSVPTGGGTVGAPASGLPSTDLGLVVEDTGSWTFWWELNKHPYLLLKAHVKSGQPSTGEGEFYLGRGQRNFGTDILTPSPDKLRFEVVPALRQALKTESNNDIVTGCLIALAKIGDPESASARAEIEKVIRPFLLDSNQEIAETAAVSLGILGSEGSLGLLISLAADAAEARSLLRVREVGYRTRAFSVYGMGLIGQRSSDPAVREQVVRQLFAILQSDKTRSQDLGTACVIALGLVPIDAAHFEPSDADGWGGAGPRPVTCRRGQIEALVAWFRDEKHDAFARAQAPWSLARLCSDLGSDQRSAVKAEIGAVLLASIARRANERAEVVQGAVLALGVLGDADLDPIDREIRKALMDAPEDLSDQQARFFSRVALAAAGARPGTGADPLAGVKEVEKHFLVHLARSRGPIRPWNALAAGVFGRRLRMAGATDPLTELGTALRSELAGAKAPAEVGAAAIGVGLLGGAGAAEQLLGLLDDVEDSEAKGHICVALGLVPAIEAKETLRKVLEESTWRPELLRQSAIGSALLLDKEVLLDLIRRLREAKSLSSQGALASAIGFIGDARSIGPLQGMLADAKLTPGSRAFAAVALGIVCDKDDLPWYSVIAGDLNYLAAPETLNLPATSTGILNIY